jgi:hypothetical protein
MTMYLCCMSSYDPDFLIISINWEKCEEKSKYLVSSKNHKNHNFQLSRAEPSKFYGVFSDLQLIAYFLRFLPLVTRDKAGCSSMFELGRPMKQSVMKPQGMNLEKSQYAGVTAFPRPSLLTQAQKCRKKNRRQRSSFLYSRRDVRQARRD